MSTSAAYSDIWGYEDNFKGVISQLTRAAFYNSQEQLKSPSDFDIYSFPVESYGLQPHNINVFINNIMDMINIMENNHTLFQSSANKPQSTANLKLFSSRTEADLMKTPKSRKKSIQSSVTNAGPLKPHKLDRLELDAKRVITSKPYLNCKSIPSEVTYAGPLPRKPRR